MVRFWGSMAINHPPHFDGFFRIARLSLPSNGRGAPQMKAKRNGKNKKHSSKKDKDSAITMKGLLDTSKPITISIRSNGWFQ
jgi:hypothetical protein